MQRGREVVAGDGTLQITFSTLLPIAKPLSVGRAFDWGRRWICISACGGSGGGGGVRRTQEEMRDAPASPHSSSSPAQTSPPKPVPSQGRENGETRAAVTQLLLRSPTPETICFGTAFFPLRPKPQVGTRTKNCGVCATVFLSQIDAPHGKFPPLTPQRPLLQSPSYY